MLVYNMPFVAMVNNFISAIFMKASLNYSNYCGVWKKMQVDPKMCGEEGNMMDWSVTSKGPEGNIHVSLSHIYSY